MPPKTKPKKGTNNICLRCHKNPKRKDHQFCSNRCTNIAAKQAPKLLRVPKGHVMYEDIKKSFKKQWHENTPLPTLARVYLITWSKKTRESFEKYRDDVANKHNPKIRPKEVKRWRAEKRACHLGDGKKKFPQLCNKKACHMCAAIRTSFEATLWFKRGLVKKKAKHLSFPYFHRAFNYSKNIANNHSHTLAFFSVRCVLGKVQKVNKPSYGRLKPPKGHDSVEGKAANGRTELVVYHKDAVRPAYLILVK